MARKKRDIILSALREIGIADYDFDVAPQEMASALGRLEAMMAAWTARGLLLGYVFGSPPDLDAESGIPAYAEEAVVTNLGLRLAPSYGRQVMDGTASVAHTAYSDLMLQMGCIPERQYPETMPTGSGNARCGYGGEFFPQPCTDGI